MRKAFNNRVVPEYFYFLNLGNYCSAFFNNSCQLLEDDVISRIKGIGVEDDSYAYAKLTGLQVQVKDCFDCLKFSIV